MWKAVGALNRVQQTSMPTTRLGGGTHWCCMPKAHGADWGKQAGNLHGINRLVKVEIDNFTATTANLAAKPGKATEGDDGADNGGGGKANSGGGGADGQGGGGGAG